jgi:hypothetical protein
MIELIRLWHAEAVSQLSLIVPGDPPAIDLCQCIVGWWAYYTPRDHTCHYDLARARLRGEGYRTTVFHEVAHHYRELLGRVPRDGHDEQWRELMIAVGMDPDSKCAMPGLAGMYAMMNGGRR